MNTNLSAVKDQLTTMLEDRPCGTTADIAEHTVIYWDGKKLVGIHLILDHPGFDGRFELDHHFLGDTHENLNHWLDDPRFSLRPEIVAWLSCRAARRSLNRCVVLLGGLRARP